MSRPRELRISDSALIDEIARISKTRGDSTPTRTATTLLYQIMPLLNERGCLTLNQGRIARRSPTTPAGGV